MSIAPENWETIKALFEEALKLGSAERPAFLLKTCSDIGVRAEVERLLSAYAQAGSFRSTLTLADFNREAELHNGRLRTGELLAGRFKIVRFIAAGGMGEVYEAEDLELREHVALKTILPDILRKPNASSRFKREIHLARKVTHPNVCRIFDIFRHTPSQGGEETLFVSMELLHGKTLAEKLEVTRRFPMQEALPLVTQMASALSAAHDIGIVHRDFKPGNIVLVSPKRDGDHVRIVVTDFGLASRSLSPAADSSASTLTTTPDLSGTPAYMAPEQIEGHPATAASDIYAFGLVIYEMVTGQRPFQGDNPVSTALKRLSQAPTPPSNLVPELRPVWEGVILRCLEREPAKRFARAQDVAAALIADAPQSPGSLPQGTAVPNDAPGFEQQTRVLETAAAPTSATPSRWSRRKNSVLAACFLVLSVIVILASFKYQRSRIRPADRTSQDKTEQSEATLRYSIIAQNYRKGRPSGEPYRVSEHQVFGANSGIHFIFSSGQLGYLYILNEGPSSTDKQPVLNTLFPSPSTNEGSAKIPRGRELTIPEGGPLIFDTHRGTEKLWLVWSKEDLPELEALKKWANFEYHGQIGNITQAQGIQSFLANSVSFSVESGGDDKNPATTLNGHGDVLVHLVTLDHE
jgi:serine/threonine protein kinase